MKFRPFAFVLLMIGGHPSKAADHENKATAKVEVLCPRSSAFLSVNIASSRPIGRVIIEVKNAAGLTLYKEEGKALTPELVRRLDKGGFPKGSLSLTVTARDFAITRPFTVE